MNGHLERGITVLGGQQLAIKWDDPPSTKSHPTHFFGRYRSTRSPDYLLQRPQQNDGHFGLAQLNESWVVYVVFFPWLFPYFLTFLSFLYMFKSSCSKRNGIMTSQIEVDVTFHPGLFSKVFKRVFETCFRMMVVLLVSLLLLPWRCCVDFHPHFLMTIQSSRQVVLHLSPKMFSPKNHLAMLEIWIFIVYIYIIYMYIKIFIYTPFLPQQKAWQLSLFNLDFWRNLGVLPIQETQDGDVPIQAQQRKPLRRDHCVSSLSPNIRNCGSIYMFQVPGPPPTPPAMVMVITHQPPSPLWNGWVLGRGGGHPTRTNRNATGRIRWRKLVSSKRSMYVERSYKTVS